MPCTSINCSPASLHHRISSEGLIKSWYWWVLLGSIFSMYSAATIAPRNDIGFLLSVEKKAWPPGLSIDAISNTIFLGFWTCSSTSRHEINSKCSEWSWTRSLVLLCSYLTFDPRFFAILTKYTKNYTFNNFI